MTFLDNWYELRRTSKAYKRERKEEGERRVYCASPIVVARHYLLECKQCGRENSFSWADVKHNGKISGCFYKIPCSYCEGFVYVAKNKVDLDN